jgi:hypothetical protein
MALRRMEELFNSRDLDAYVELLDPAVEWHVSREDPDRPCTTDRPRCAPTLRAGSTPFTTFRFTWR